MFILGRPTLWAPGVVIDTKGWSKLPAWPDIATPVAWYDEPVADYTRGVGDVAHLSPLLLLVVVRRFAQELALMGVEAVHASVVDLYQENV
jgi:hypothetical protein